MINDIANPLCMLSFEHKDKPILNVCRRPIKLAYDWSYVQNKNFEMIDDSIHFASSISKYLNASLLINFKVKNKEDKIQLIKEGSDNLNGVLDAYLEKEFLVVKVYYDFRQRTSIMLETLKIPFKIEDGYNTLCISIDSKNFKINVFENSKIIKSHAIKYSSALNNTINNPISNTLNNNHLIVGDKNIDVKYFGVFSNVLTPLTYSTAVL